MNARQKKLCDAVAELIDIDDVEAREYYGVCGVDDKYNNIRDFLHLFKNVSDKIADKSSPAIVLSIAIPFS